MFENLILVDFIHRSSRFYYLFFNYLSYYLYGYPVYAENPRRGYPVYAENPRRGYPVYAWKTALDHSRLWKLRGDRSFQEALGAVFSGPEAPPFAACQRPSQANGAA